MKILFISHKHPPSLGGMETQSFHLVNGLSKRYDVLKLVLKANESRLMFFLRLKSRVKKILNHHPDIDIIHLNDGLMAFMLNWLPNYTTLPIVTTFHGLDLIFPSNYYQRKLSNFKKSNCYLITVSKSTFDHAIKLGFNASRTTHINNGVDHEFGNKVDYMDMSTILKNKNINIDEDEFVLVAIGRAVPRKGFSWFIKNVMPELNKTKLLIIGPNNVTGLTKLILKILPQKTSVFIATLMGYTTDFQVAKEATLQHKLDNDVYFLGGIPFAHMVNILKQSDLFIMPNIPFEGDKEGFGLVILEANICKKYVVAANIEGITSAIYNGHNGSLLPTKNAQAWIKKINELKQDTSAVKRMGVQANKFVVENFGWEKMVIEYENVFIKIIA